MVLRGFDYPRPPQSLLSSNSSPAFKDETQRKQEQRLVNNIWAGARNLTVTVTHFFEIIIAIMSFLPVFIPWPHQGNLVISHKPTVFNGGFIIKCS